MHLSASVPPTAPLEREHEIERVRAVLSSAGQRGGAPLVIEGAAEDLAVLALGSLLIADAPATALTGVDQILAQARARGRARTVATRRVTELAAAGSTNREIAQTIFVTEKTAETHLGRSFRKLDITSRRQLPTCSPALSVSSLDCSATFEVPCRGVPPTR